MIFYYTGLNYCDVLSKVCDLLNVMTIRDKLYIRNLLKLISCWENKLISLIKEKEN